MGTAQLQIAIVNTTQNRNLIEKLPYSNLRNWIFLKVDLNFKKRQFYDKSLTTSPRKLV